MTAIDKARMLEFRGQVLGDREGDAIGAIEEIYLDAGTGEPQWALVHTGMFGTRRSFVPLRGATEVDGAPRVPVDRRAVKDAPPVEPNGQLSEAEREELERHYDDADEEAPAGG